MAIERTFEFRILSRRPDGTMCLSGILAGVSVDLLLTAQEWARLGESASWWKEREQRCPHVGCTHPMPHDHPMEPGEIPKGSAQRKSD
jgi:hypothetical protein